MPMQGSTSPLARSPEASKNAAGLVNIAIFIAILCTHCVPMMQGNLYYKLRAYEMCAYDARYCTINKIILDCELEAYIS